MESRIKHKDVELGIIWDLLKHLSYHLCNASVGEDVSSVYEPVKHLCCLFYQVTLVGVIFQLLI